MSKRKATKRQEAVHPPEIQRFLEWQEKQYLPGYYTGQGNRVLTPRPASP